MTARTSRGITLMLLTFAALTAATACAGRSKQPGPASTTGTPTTGTPPSRPVIAGPGGPTIDGARQAALDYLRLSERVVGLDDRAAEALQREAASLGAADDLVEELVEALAALRRAYPDGSVSYRVAPLGVRIQAQAIDRMVAEVWFVGVVVPPAGAAYEEWRTARYELVWERDGWRVAAEDSRPGPRPAAPSQPAPVLGPALAAVLDGYESIPRTSVSAGRRP